MKRKPRFSPRWAPLAAAAMLLLIGACSPQRAYEALLVLGDIAAGDGPSRLKKTTPTPQRRTVAFAVARRSYRGDLYRPGETVRAGLMLMPGAAEKGKDDPRLIAFAETLARAGFLVLVPDLESLKELRVRPGNITEAGDAFLWLAERPALQGCRPVGMAGFSYAAGPVLLAALEPPVRERVDFILSVGGYYDLRQVLTFFTTGYFRHRGAWRHREPNAYGKWVFVLSNLHRLSDPADRQLLRRMAERKMRSLSAPVADLASGLGPEGRDLYAFLANDRPERAPRLLARLPEGIRADLAALNLAGKDLCRMQARVLLVHGYDDPIIPYPQSIALERYLPEGRVRLFLVHGLVHVDVDPGWFDSGRLWRLIYTLLSERDRQGGCAAGRAFETKARPIVIMKNQTNAEGE